MSVHVRVDDLVDLAWTVNARGVDFVPAFRRITTNECRAAHVGDAFDGFAIGQASRHFDDGPLGVAVEQDVSAGVDQDRVANLVLPVVIVSDAAQRCFDATQNDRHVLVGFLAALAVDQTRTVRTLARHAAWGVGVIGADLFVGGVTVDHRIHVAGRDAEEQVRLAELHEVVF